MNRTSPFSGATILYALLAIALLSMPSCRKDNDPVPSGPTSAGTAGFNADLSFPNYLFTLDHISGEGESKILVGDTVSTSWSEVAGLVWLGADEFHEPLMTLTLGIDSFSYSTDLEILVGHVGTAVLSTSDVQSGTVDVLNARRYQLDSGLSTLDAFIAVDTISGAILAGTLFLRMHRVQTNPDTIPPPEGILLSGDFVNRNN